MVVLAENLYISYRVIFVLFEAQLNCFLVVAPDNVTKEINLTGNIQFLSLGDRLDEWIFVSRDAKSKNSGTIHNEMSKV